ncbi:MAG: hypothetical protein OEY31_15175 [Candidatus Bathyarchaeota archaeon]|nr:hypothetical protein [Candidatus Bathyarchaeota archaeon]
MTYKAHAAPPKKHASITSMGTANIENELALVPQYPKSRVPTFSKAKSKNMRKKPTMNAISKLVLGLFRCSRSKSRKENTGMIHQLKGMVDGNMKLPNPKKKSTNSNTK